MVMKMNKKVLNIVELVIKFLVIIVLVILIWYRVNSLDLEEKKAVEIGPGIYSKDPENVYNSEYKVDGLAFREISYLYDFNTGSTFNIRIINNNDKIYSLDGFTIVINDEDGKEITRVDVDLKADIDPGSSIDYNFDVNGDIIGTKKYKSVYILKK